MVTEQQATEYAAGRIEGGLDAVVIGASPDALAAAAYLGKAGLNTVLVSADQNFGGPIQSRKVGDHEAGLGEHLVSHLDGHVVSDLNLFKHGLKYAARRLDTTYFFENEVSITLPGDPTRAFQSRDLVDEADTDRLQDFTRRILYLAENAGPWLDGPLYDGAGPDDMKKAFERAGDDAQFSRAMSASVSDALSASFPPGPLLTLLSAEAAFRSSSGPDEPFSFFNLVRRWRGEAAGLRGAIACPIGGFPSIVGALRRAAQHAKVDLRASVAVRSVVIEWDAVAGVELANGGQIRTPIVVDARDAKSVFLTSIGREKINLEFQRLLIEEPASMGAAQLLGSVNVKTLSRDDRRRLSNRIVFCPPKDDIMRAFRSARRSAPPEYPVVEVVFPTLLENRHTDRSLVSALIHPSPIDLDENAKAALMDSLFVELNRLIPNFRAELFDAEILSPSEVADAAGSDVALFAAARPVLPQLARANMLAEADGIGGLFYCGPDVQIGPGLSCSAGRHAAQAAIKYARRIGVR